MIVYIGTVNASGPPHKRCRAVYNIYTILYFFFFSIGMYNNIKSYYRYVTLLYTYHILCRYVPIYKPIEFASRQYRMVLRKLLIFIVKRMSAHCILFSLSRAHARHAMFALSRTNLVLLDLMLLKRIEH